MNGSHASGLSSVNIKSRGDLKVRNESSVISNFIESGNVKLTGNNVLLQNKSVLAGSKKIEIEAVEFVQINDNSIVEIGWEYTPKIEQNWDSIDILWDSKTGKIVDHTDNSPNGVFKNESSIISKMKSWHGDWQTINIIDVNQPYDYLNIPHVSINSAYTSVDNVIINGFSGDAKSAIRIGSNDHIKFSGKTAIQGFDQVELNANSIEVLKGVKFQSKLDDQEIPSGYFIVNSLDSAVFNGATIHGGFVVNSDGNICLLYTSPSPRDVEESRMPSSA